MTVSPLAAAGAGGRDESLVSVQQGAAVVVRRLAPGASDAPLLLIVAGWRSPLASFAPLAQAIAAGPVLGVGLTGQEFQAPRPGRLGIGELAADVAEVAERLSLERYAVLGHGHGANVALALAARDPRRVAALVLLDGGYYTYSDLYTPREWEESAELLQGAYPSLGEVDEAFERLVRAPARARPTAAWETARRAFARAERDAIRVHVNPDSDAQMLAEGYSFDARRYQPLAQPVLLVLGSRAYEPDRRRAFFGAAEAFAGRCPRCTVARVDAGHYPHLDRPVKTAWLVTQFLRHTLGLEEEELE